MQNVAVTSNKRSMKNNQNPATVHHIIMTARRPDNIRSSILVRGWSIRSMARSCRRLRRPLPRKDSHFCHFGGVSGFSSILLVQSLCTIFNILLLVFYLLWSKSYILYSIMYLVSTISILYMYILHICYVLDSKFNVLYMVHILTSILLVPSLMYYIQDLTSCILSFMS